MHHDPSITARRRQLARELRGRAELVGIFAEGFVAAVADGVRWIGRRVTRR